MPSPKQLFASNQSQMRSRCVKMAVALKLLYEPEGAHDRNVSGSRRIHRGSMTFEGGVISCSHSMRERGVCHAHKTCVHSLYTGRVGAASGKHHRHGARLSRCRDRQNRWARLGQGRNQPAADRVVVPHGQDQDGIQKYDLPQKEPQRGTRQHAKPEDHGARIGPHELLEDQGPLP